MPIVAEITTTLEFDIFTCDCGLTYGLPKPYVAQLRESHKTFYCPNGCPRHYAQENTAEKLRNELRIQKEYTREYQVERDELKRELQKVKERVSNGVCPCCNRTFKRLERHMTAKHPEYYKKKK